MKNIIAIFGAIILASSILTSCSKKPEDACDCIKKSANEYIINGVKPSTFDLKQTCKDLIDKFKEDPKGRSLIESCGDEVLQNVKDKKFSVIDGEEIPLYPTHTFNTVEEFLNAFEAKHGEYKYWKTNIIIKNAYLGMQLQGGLSDNEGNFKKLYKPDGYYSYGYFVTLLNKAGVKIGEHYFMKANNTEFVEMDYTSKPEINLLIPKDKININEINSSIEIDGSSEAYLNGEVVQLDEKLVNEISGGKKGLACLTNAEIQGVCLGMQEERRLRVYPVLLIDKVTVVSKKPYPAKNQKANNNAISNNEKVEEVTTSLADEEITKESIASTSGKFPQSSQRLLTATDLKGMSKPDLILMRNEIFARHGYIFKTTDMKSYFSRQPWYKAKYEDVTSMLSNIEQQNVALIKNFE